MICKTCTKKLNIINFRKYRKTCKHCEYTTRINYQIKYQEDNKERIRIHKSIYMKSKNFYIPVLRKKKSRIPHICNPQTVDMNPPDVVPLSVKDIYLTIKVEFLV